MLPFETSPTFGEYAKALFALQGEIDAITKDAKNPFFKNSYATINKIWEDLLPLLQKYGFLVTQFPVGEFELLTFVIHVPSGEWMRGTAKIALKEIAPHAQCGGITYLSRYAIVSIFRLLTEDDDGNVASNVPSTPPRLGQRMPTRSNAA
jgi:hypothetical protein